MQDLFYRVRKVEGPGAPIEKWSQEEFRKLFESLPYPARIDAIEVLVQIESPTVENIEVTVDIMDDVICGNRPQPITAEELEEIQQDGFLIIAHGAEGVATKDMDTTENAPHDPIWPEVQRELLAAIGRAPNKWNPFHSKVVAALFLGGIGDIRPAGMPRDTTLWRALFRTGFQSVAEKCQMPANYHIPHHEGHDADAPSMAKATIEWLMELLGISIL